MRRIKTNIPGFDDIVYGGLPEGSTVVVSGAPGTGKSIFGMQYIYEGAKLGEPGVYVTFEQNEQDLREQALQFGWDFDKYMKIARIVKGEAWNVEDMLLQLNKINLEVGGIKRLVIDSITAISTFSLTYSTLLSQIPGQAWNIIKESAGFPPLPPRDVAVRELLYKIINQIKAIGATTLLISEVEEENKYSKEGIVEFMADGIIALQYLSMTDGTYRNIHVVKLRLTNHKTAQFDYNIVDKKGIVIEKNKIQTIVQSNI